MPSTFYEMHPKTQAAIKVVVQILDCGKQPGEGLNLLPAIDFEYAEFEVRGEELGDLVLTSNGEDAAARWREPR